MDVLSKLNILYCNTIRGSSILNQLCLLDAIYNHYILLIPQLLSSLSSSAVYHPLERQESRRSVLVPLLYNRAGVFSLPLSL